ncbi:MAG: type 4a pilus biogenesis protein PilO [Thermodesulfobacteriota bacterium]
MSEGLSNALGGLNMESLNEFRKEILAALILLSFTLLLYVSVYKDNTVEERSLGIKASEVNSDIARIKTEIQTTGPLKIKLEQTAVNIRRIEDRVEELKRKLPTEKNLSELLADITRNGLKGVKVTAVKPLSIEDRGEYTRVPFQIDLDSKYKPFANYLDRIGKLDRVMDIDNFIIDSKGNTRGLVSIKLYLSAYVLNGP